MKRTEAQLIQDAKRGNLRALDDLIRSHEGLCRYHVREFYIRAGGDDDDLMQEARIGVMKAVRDFDPVQSSWLSFVHLCVERQVITAVKTANRIKHSPLSDSVRVGFDEQGEPVSIIDLLPSFYSVDPYRIVVALESIRVLVAAYKKLSPLERRAMSGVASGHTYCEIEGLPQGSVAKVKRIDNAVQRARLRMQHALDDADRLAA